MKIAKIPHYVKRAHQLGPVKAIEMIAHRVQTSWFEQYIRYQAEQKKASYSWCTLSSKTEIKDFQHFFAALKAHSFAFVQDIYHEERAQTDTLLQQADAFAYNCFDILGSREQCLITMPWHSDFRLRYQNQEADYLFDKRIFYKDFIVQAGLTDRLSKDIKVPWELSRFQHLFVMGAAYEKNNNEIYARSFVQHVTDFMNENPFLLGPNWVCPMDVGIRALNWVWGFHFFKNSPEISLEFWERFVCALYDHLYYLEHNWELFGVTSNHYLSDLIGYFYVTWFFKDVHDVKRKHEWCFKELLKELEKQVFDEGTDYEGSTKYHGLVSEIFYHFYQLSQESGFVFPKSAYEKIQRMFSFIDWVSIHDADMVKIGDDDSGKILYFGITPGLVSSMRQERTTKEHFFKQFGLSVHKSDTWHVTLRHHSYSTEQPSGHFHNDIASVTIGYKGVPLIVDPGSYVYTPSVVWRNHFRSSKVHNAFFIENIEPVEFNKISLFVLDIPEQDTTHDSLWKVNHRLYSVEATRVVDVSEEKACVTIVDTWEETLGQECTSIWNMTLHPDITARKAEDGIYLQHHGKDIARIISPDLSFILHQGWYSPSYGTKVSCIQLRSESSLNAQPTTIQIIGL